MSSSGPAAIGHIAVLMLENRSFDPMSGFLYAGNDNVSPAGRPCDELSGLKSNKDGGGRAVPVFKIPPTSSDVGYRTCIEQSVSDWTSAYGELA